MSKRTRITPCANYIYVQPLEEEFSPGGIALPQISKDEAEGMRTWKGLVHSYSLMAYRQVRESIGEDKMHLFDYGSEIEYYGHSTTKIDGVEFHVIKPVDIWSIHTQQEE